MRVIHLEDSDPDAELVAHKLSQAWPECRVQRAASQAQFQDALEAEDFDVILSDYTMSGYDGLSALELAHTRYPEKPFIFLSGTIGEERAIEALKRGATDYVIKGNMNRLVPAVNRALDNVRERKQRQRVEQQLREHAELLDRARDAICVTDLKGRLTYWNKSAAQIFGWEGREMYGHSLPRLWSLPDSTAFAEAHQRVLADGVWLGELPVTTSAGRELTLQSHWTLVGKPGCRPQSILLINTDVTEQKKLEKQLLRTQRLESIGTLAGGIAHNLNNIFTPIFLSIDMMRQRIEDKKTRRYLDMLATSAQHGAALVRQILVFARSSAEDERAPLQPGAVISAVANLLGKTLPPSIAIETDLAENLGFVLGSSIQLSQVLMNLCLNASEAMPGGGRLTIRAQNTMVEPALALANPGSQSGPHVVIAVADTGTGIPPGVLDRIFDPFFTTKQAGKSTGLGLSIVLGIVQAHGGFLQVESKAGSGTVFRIFLPVTPAEAPIAVPTDDKNDVSV